MHTEKFKVNFVMALTRKRKLMSLTTLLACIFLYQNLYRVGVIELFSEEADSVLHSLSFHALHLSFSKKNILLQIYIGNDTLALKAIIGNNLPHPLQFKVTKTQRELALEFAPMIHLKINSVKLRNVEKVKCYRITWSRYHDNGNDFSFHDGIHIENSYWYGGAIMHKSFWPINNRSHTLAPFVTGDSFRNDYGSIQERFWLSSSGSSIFVEYDVPLFVGINHLNPGWMSLVAKKKKPYGGDLSRPLVLNYTLCTCSQRSPREMFLSAAGGFWKRPTGIPNVRLFKFPSWSTWAAFKRSISSEVLMKFAHDIASHGFKCSQLIIDDGWATHYGDFEFNSDLFPSPQQLISKLKLLLNTTLSLWVHPFASIFSSSFWKCDSHGKSFWVRSYFDWLPRQVIWWNGLGSLLDITNGEAYTWYLSELERVQVDYDVDSFKFDAGESLWLPTNGVTARNLDNPNDYTQLYSTIAYTFDVHGQRLQEVRSLASSQQLPIFVRLIDKNSDWSEDNGILSIIPQILTAGLIGYPFVFPDMIGGNGYFGIFIHFTVLPERELYIRWLQLSALMPTMQFSIPPWSFDNEVVAIAKNMSELHLSYSDLIIALATEAVETGAPIIRPLWWTLDYSFQNESEIDSEADMKELFTCETEFMLGNDVLVAPVIEKGARSREVYLPSGTWVRGGQGGVPLRGNSWHVIEVALDQLAYFIREV